jgi:Putative addiction module component
MTAAARSALNQVLNLSEDEQMEVLAELAKVVPEESLSPEEWNRLWARELNKRIADIESGAVKCIPYAEARKGWDKILGKS